MALITLPGTLAHRNELEVHLLEALDQALEAHNDATLRELTWAFARCAGALLGELVRQWEAERAQQGRWTRAKTVRLLTTLARQMHEARLVGLEDWTGHGLPCPPQEP